MSNPVSSMKPETTIPSSDPIVDYVDHAKKLLAELRAQHPNNDITIDITQDYDKRPRAKIEMRKSHESDPPRSHLPEQIFMGAVGLSAVAVAAGYVLSVFRKKPDTK